MGVVELVLVVLFLVMVERTNLIKEVTIHQNMSQLNVAPILSSAMSLNLFYGLILKKLTYQSEEESARSTLSHKT